MVEDVRSCWRGLQYWKSMDFNVQRVAVLRHPSQPDDLASIMASARAAVINRTDAPTVRVTEAGAYAAEDRPVVVSLQDGAPAAIHFAGVDERVARMLQSVGLDHGWLSTHGLTLCGGSLLMALLSDRAMDRKFISDHGFDLDLFITGAASTELAVVAEKLVNYLDDNPSVAWVDAKRLGFCMDITVTYTDATKVKVQVVDLGVQCGPVELVQTFDLSCCRLFLDNETATVKATEDCAYCLANKVIIYDRRFRGDSRYPARLLKYAKRTGFPIAVDAAAAAVFEFVREFGDQLTFLIGSRCPSTMREINAALQSWFAELPMSDVTVFATTCILLPRIQNVPASVGYTNQQRVDCPPITGTCGRPNLDTLARPQCELSEMYAMFMLHKIERQLSTMIRKAASRSADKVFPPKFGL